MANLPEHGYIKFGDAAIPFVNADSFITNHILTTSGAQTITIPTGDNDGKARLGFISADGDFWLRYGGTAAVPSASVTDGTGSERNPASIAIGSGLTSISAIATLANATVRKISVRWYR